jgi:DNA processing protein
MPTKKSSQYQLKNALALSIMPKIGDFLAKNLISYCGGLDAVFAEKRKNLALIPGIGDLRAKSIIQFNDWARVEKEIEFIDKFDINPLFYLDDAYPKRLKAHADSPVLIFKKGEADLNSTKMVSIVGTRNATKYGKGFIADLISDLKPYNVSVVSGLAHGIDTSAHKEAIKNNLPTLAVLGHGFKSIYPSINKGLASQIANEKGALLTEYFSDVPGSPENFPTRNRIVAGLCDSIIVVESAYKGGSMITAEIAHSYDKLCFALPGNYSSKYSQGCNLLIKLNKAHLIENVGDLIYHLNWDAKELESKQTVLFEELNEVEQKVVHVLKKGEMGIDNIYHFSKIPMSKLSLILLDLELKNVIKTLPGKMYDLV